MKKLFVLVITLTTALAAHAQVSVQVGYLSNTLKAENKAVGKLAGTYRGITERNNFLSISVGYVF